MNKERTKVLTSTATRPLDPTDPETECVLYWMQRDVRARDNWALLFARHLAKRGGVPLRVCYALPPPPPPTGTDDDDGGDDDDDDDLPPKVTDIPMTERHGSFLLGGLKFAERELATAGVPMEVLLPLSRSAVGDAVVGRATSEAKGKALAVVCDFSPLRHHRDWTEGQAAPLLDAEGVPLIQVDAHNIVPVWHASPKREVGARTLRPKINKLLPDFLTHFPAFEGNAHLAEGEGTAPPKIRKTEWDEFRRRLALDPAVPACDWAKPGADAAMDRFAEFCSGRSPGLGLKKFAELRNDPNCQGVCSDLSPWINHGQVSFQRLALDVRAVDKYSEGKASYIEEGVVRRELSDNFCYYARDSYDSLDAAAEWARDSLDLHASDEREYVYTLEEFEKGRTHDDLWNAAQMQLVKEGGMHGFLRMYWAKKILEWTPSPAVALRTAQYFNDRFALDGNDPNGFVGVGWSVMGIHDMGWKERPVFGKIRFMNYAGCKRKFKVDGFVARYRGARENAIAASKKKAQGGSGKKTVSGKKRKVPST
uniref:Deoxyribodipyrimidine photo-lyase n=1 Tax=Trieres chinensis TaxID=1514140 RepID=A0A7S2EMG3_TRICV|mmetsp:Transcript_30536/g.62260  ORF Transcript_30536/g.62260 Transcript_30536/m.62260 type:complete len:537 (+) Transcript_30536:177-1787(+)